MGKDTSNNKIWHKIIKKFNQAKFDYVLVGGAALVIHGLPRSTIDIDIYIPAKEEVLHKLFDIAHSLGLKSRQKSILAISHYPNLFVDQWICFSYKGQDILDVFFSGEKEFNKLYKASERRKDKTISIRVACLNDIIKMKKNTGRPIDLADIELIKEIKNTKHKRKNT